MAATALCWFYELPVQKPYLVETDMDRYFTLIFAKAPQSQSEIATDEGISPRRGGVLGYSFQLAITAPLYSIIGYCIATAQSCPGWFSAT